MSEYVSDPYVPYEELNAILASRPGYTIHSTYPTHDRDSVTIIWEKKCHLSEFGAYTMTTGHAFYPDDPHSYNNPNHHCKDFVESSRGMVCRVCGKKPMEAADADQLG